MQDIKPRSSVSLDEANGEVHFSIAGFWTPEEMKVFLRELDMCAVVLIKKGKPFSAVADMSEFLPQDRRTAEVIREHLERARRQRLSRIAVLSPPTLVKLQYSRLAEGIDVRFFDSREDAHAWLRG